MSVRELRQGYEKIQSMTSISRGKEVHSKPQENEISEVQPDLMSPPGLDWIDAPERKGPEKLSEVNCFFGIDAGAEGSKHDGDLMSMFGKSDPKSGTGSNCLKSRVLWVQEHPPQ